MVILPLAGDRGRLGEWAHAKRRVGVALGEWFGEWSALCGEWAKKNNKQQTILQKTLKARQEWDVIVYPPYNPRRIWPLLKKTSKIHYKKHYKPDRSGTLPFIHLIILEEYGHF